MTPLSKLIQSVMDAVPHPSGEAWVKGKPDGSDGNWFVTMHPVLENCQPTVAPHIIWVYLSPEKYTDTRREIPFRIIVKGAPGLRESLRSTLLDKADDSGITEGEDAIAITLSVSYGMAN